MLDGAHSMKTHGYVLVVLAGVGLGAGVSAAYANRPYVGAIVRKSLGRDEPCPWRSMARAPLSQRQFDDLVAGYRGRIQRTGETDDPLGIERFQTPTRRFWLKKAGSVMDGRKLLTFILAEEDWIMTYARGREIRRGDVVVDVGAHVGTFGDDALRRGASKVVMVEPDPVNVECIRRNFPAEIADGRVVIVPEGAWSSAGTLTFSIGVGNSGEGSLVIPDKGSRSIDVRTRPLDDMLRELGIGRVDFIKMDIEGAEREALKGAAQTLSRFKPRLMLDAYHLADDSVVLPRLITSINGGYREYCAVCSFRSETDFRIVPYAIFFD
jgi:FkbM family methyltransferase